MKKNFVLNIVFAVTALFTGVLMAISTERWQDGMERSQKEMVQAKHEFIHSAGLMELHNKVYAEVGEKAWRTDVRPTFMMYVTLETARETGDIVPDWRDVVAWTRSHPERARELLLRAAAVGNRP